MSGKEFIVNTHPGKNPLFVGGLADFLDSLAVEYEIISGYEDINLPEDKPSHIILTGVPIDVDYSLTQKETQKVVETGFNWLRECDCPVLGICYGNQILGHIFGGKVDTLSETVKDAHYPLHWQPDRRSGIFAGVGRLEVFAEHRDYISEIPEGFTVLCQQDGIPYILYGQEKEFYGVQFVPTLSDEDSKQILKRFLGK
ncbi:MAG: gamma-glutamyl-gamma-aminobutyrate hydrolase family protein [Anaerolineales bacterium]